MTSTTSSQRRRLLLARVVLTLLLAAVFTLGSLDTPFEPRNWRDVLTLYAVSSFITAALIVFALILTRTVLRLWAERSKEQLGARFKTRMVVGAMALSLLPVRFMFSVSYSLLNRTLGRWFPRPLEIASEQTQILFTDLGRTTTLPRLRMMARQVQANSSLPTNELLQRAFALGLDAVWLLDKDGKPLRGGVICDDQPEDRSGTICQHAGVLGSPLHTLPSGVEVWQAQGKNYLVARIPTVELGKNSGYVAAGFGTNPDFLNRFTLIQSKTREYDTEKQNLRTLKRQMLLILAFFTILLLFSVMWLALFLAKQVTFLNDTPAAEIYALSLQNALLL